MSTPQRILVTGYAGRIGRAVVKELNARGHTVVGLDVVENPGLPLKRWERVNPLKGSPTLEYVETLRKAATVDNGRVDAIIHLAATADDKHFPRGIPPDDSDNFVDELVPNNVLAPYYVMETARQLGIKRVILASSGQVIDGHLREDNIPVTPDSPFRPKYLYACTKVFLEALGQVYATEHRMAVLAVRLGWCPRDKKQVAEIDGWKPHQDVYLSPGDAGRFFAATVEVESLPPFSVVYATSRHRHRLRYDLSESQRILGWSPLDRWPFGSEDDLNKS